MSLYADYIKEREEKDIIETDKGFATFKIFENGECYLQDLYVVPAQRQSGVATEFTDKVCEIAAERGAHTLVGSVCVDDSSASRNMFVFLRYGMEIYKTVGPMIFLKKKIRGDK